jgi:hypothetical protein
MITGYLGLFTVPVRGQNCGRTSARGAGNEFIMLYLVAPKIAVSLVRRSVVVWMDRYLRSNTKNVGVSLRVLLGD